MSVVYVHSCKSEWLMPTTPSRARVFLKKGKAQVINKTPFSIKLTFETTTYHQKISVGIGPRENSGAGGNVI